MSKQTRTAAEALMQGVSGNTTQARQTRQRATGSSAHQALDPGGSDSGFPGPVMGSAATSAATHSTGEVSATHRDAIRQAVEKRRELWEEELDAARRACTFAESSKSKQGTMRLTREKLWKVIWVMHISGIADGSEELRQLRIRELGDIDERVVSAHLEKLETALAAVAFMPLEDRLQVVTSSPYPIEPDLSFYNWSGPRREKARKDQPSFVANVLKNAESYSKAIEDWQYEHGCLLLDPFDPINVPENKDKLEPGIYKNPRDYQSRWFSDAFRGYEDKVKNQKVRTLLVTYNPEIVEEQQKRSIHEDFLPKPPKDRVERTLIDLSIIPTNSKPDKQAVSDCFLPVCEVCGKKIWEPNDELVKERRLRIAPEDEVKLQYQQKKEDIEYLRSVKKTVYFHYDCWPGFIGYCFTCRKPFMDEADVVRFTRHFIFHRGCLRAFQDSSTAASSAENGSGGAGV
jgi:hypothetical protein